MHSGSEAVTRADEILTAVRVKILPSRDVKFGCESSILWFEKLKFRPKLHAAAGLLEFLPRGAMQRVRQNLCRRAILAQAVSLAKFGYLREISENER